MSSTDSPTGRHRPGGHSFELDQFQRDAIAALDRGESVLVAAPTGAGKTVVAEHAVAMAASAGGRAFYTTPIKALSNQKYHDLSQTHGRSQVGLLTGDNAVNGEAPVVVMTTEVLRNMLYARSPALRGLRCVVLDEVHFLQDPYRGPVWEEVIIHLDPAVRIVALSATVSNASELADWLTDVRGPTATVVEHRRPVSLDHHYLVGDKVGGSLQLLATLDGGRPNPRATRFDATPDPVGRGRPRRRWFTPNRAETLELLADRQMLPAIYFIFSRAACNDAVEAWMRTGSRLTTAVERERVRVIAEAHVEQLSDDDLDVLGYATWVAGLEMGVAAHHAGMVPPFKEAVEACFLEGLVKAVFATETLALGINMPARTVVIEKLTKFTGERHEFLTPAQYTQLTGRAGRRGIDEHGDAIVLWSPWVPFADVAALASSRSFRLQSSFRPTYNMAANLVRRYTADEAHHLLNLSFAQYQADQAVVKIEARLRRRQADLEEIEVAASCERGDVAAYAADLERSAAQARADRSAEKAGVDEGVRRLVPGDIIRLHGEGGPKCAVLSVGERRGGAVRLRVVTPGARMLQLGAADFDVAPPVIGRIELPRPFDPLDRDFQAQVVDRLRRAPVSPPADPVPAPGAGGHDAWDPAGGSLGDEVRGDEPGTSAGQVRSCPDRDAHLKAFRKARRLRREVADLGRQVAGHTETLSRQFDRVLRLLEAWGYLDGWHLTERGESLVRVFHECDLLVAECLHEGLFDDLDPAGLAGMLSCLTYEHRTASAPRDPWFPSDKVEHRFDRMLALAGELRADEQQSGLPATRVPDPTFFAIAHAWAAGEQLDDVLDDEEISAGDFVRNVKQLIDLLRQIERAARPATGAAARRAAEALFRGVVAASTAVRDEAGIDEAGIDEAIEVRSGPAARPGEHGGDLG